MIIYQSDACIVSLPMPLFFVVEDVGWWQGEDGSARGGPLRNRFPRRHCLADYRALVRLAERLRVRLADGMVFGEWDRTNLLKDIAGATWQGRQWDNRRNQGPWLDDTAQFLRDNERYLELAVHGLCHEFWQDGIMERSEFHNDHGHMRAKEIVVDHLRAYGEILRQNGFSNFPRLFLPPALHHSFGNGEAGVQAILRDFGIDYVTTRFDKTRQHAPPVNEKITWECGVVLLERGLSPVGWSETAARPTPLPMNPIVALHWGNLLHADPERSAEVIDRWAERILLETEGFDRILAADAADCWRQAAVYYLADVRRGHRTVSIGLRRLPLLPSLTGPFTLKIRQKKPENWRCAGAGIVSCLTDRDGVSTVRLRPESDCQEISLYLP